jgi:hypothetical protein
MCCALSMCFLVSRCLRISCGDLCSQDIWHTCVRSVSRLTRATSYVACPHPRAPTPTSIHTSQRQGVWPLMVVQETRADTPAKLPPPSEQRSLCTHGGEGRERERTYWSSWLAPPCNFRVYVCIEEEECSVGCLSVLMSLSS